MPAKRFPVEAGHILLFARSIGDPNPIYADEQYARGTALAIVMRNQNGEEVLRASATARIDP